MVRTTNAGRTWVSQTSGTTNTLLGVSFTDANTGMAVGDFGTHSQEATGQVTLLWNELVRIKFLMHEDTFAI